LRGKLNKLVDMKQRKKIIMLPSETGIMSKCKISYSEDVGLAFNKGDLRMDTDGHKDWWENQHLYILSDEEIKEGDWVLWFWDGGQIGVTEPQKYLGGEQVLNNGHKKIIATTDPHLFVNAGEETIARASGFSQTFTKKEMLPQIPQHIIEAYVKNPFDEVEVEYEPSVFGEYDGEIIYNWDDEENPKLNQDGTLAVSLVEEKMYSRDEVEELCRNSHLLGMKETLPGYPKPETIDEWIKENL
jgi:hypothetical protein